MASLSTLTPILTATPGAPPTYNVGMAETFSWIPVEGAGRPLYARASYIANPEDIKVSLSAANINVSLDELELNTDNIEELIETTNNVLTAFKLETDVNIERANTLLDLLTGTQNESVSLLEALTANTNDLEELVIENNTLLNSLTALQNSKQNSIITFLNVLTANTNSLEINTDDVESLVGYTNTKLDSLTSVDYATSSKQNVSNGLLNSLTAIQVDKQDQIITLLHSITGTAIEVDLNTDQLEVHVDGVETLLHDLTASNKYVPGFSIPPYDEISFNYVGSTDIFRTVTYLNNSTQVMALSFTYVTEPPTVGDAIIQSVKKI